MKLVDQPKMLLQMMAVASKDAPMRRRDLSLRALLRLLGHQDEVSACAWVKSFSGTYYDPKSCKVDDLEAIPMGESSWGKIQDILNVVIVSALWAGKAPRGRSR